MPNHKIANTTSSMLDMSPLKDLLGRTLTLKAKEERDIDDKTFHDDIVQRIIKASWIIEVKEAPSEASSPEAPQVPPTAPEVPAAPTASETPPTPAAEPEHPAPVEPIHVSEPPAVEPEPAPMPVETPVVSETPVAESPTASSNKANKNRR